MKNSRIAILLLSMTGFLSAADQANSALRGSVEKVDEAAKSFAVKAADGTLYTVTVSETTVTEGYDSKSVWGHLKQGSHVVIHGTKTGAELTATGLYRVGEGGLTASKATVKAIGKGGHSVVVKTADGAEATYHLTSKAVVGTAKGLTTGSKVVVYSTTKAGKKIAHFFELEPKA